MSTFSLLNCQMQPVGSLPFDFLEHTSNFIRNPSYLLSIRKIHFLENFFPEDFIYLFLERGEGREKREGKTSMSGCLPCVSPPPPTGCCRNLGNQRPSGSQASTQSTKPHQPGSKIPFIGNSIPAGTGDRVTVNCEAELSWGSPRLAGAGGGTEVPHPDVSTKPWASVSELPRRPRSLILCGPEGSGCQQLKSSD